MTAIDEIRLLAAKGVVDETALAVAAEAVRDASEPGQLRDLMDAISLSAQARALLWESRRPDEAYIGTGRARALGEAAYATPEIGPDSAGVRAFLADLRSWYGHHLMRIDRDLDEPTHTLLADATEDIVAQLASLPTTS